MIRSKREFGKAVEAEKIRRKERGQGARCHHLLTRQCPMLRAGVLFGSPVNVLCTVPCNAPVTFYATFFEVYGDKLAALCEYQRPDRGKLNIQKTELRVRTIS